ncbi:MAG TPA: AMP-binding protein [Ktedonobacteraceae bacterium]|nr:AMP-binding protein [Ktedonobacteraceae bacterium]
MMISDVYNIYDIIGFQARQTPDNIAITTLDRSPLTYQRLFEQIGTTHNTLHSLGIGRHDRVATVLPDGPEMAVAFVAITTCATMAPLNPGYQAREFDFYLSDLMPKVLIVQAELPSPARAVAQALGIRVVELVPLLDAPAGIFSLSGDSTKEPSADNATQSDDVALLLHTSGTTSRPKIVALTQANLCSSCYNIRAALQLTQQDRCLNIMPLFHIHGLMAGLLASLAAGASIVCPVGFYPARFFELMNAFHPSWYTAVPTIHQSILLQAPSHWEVIESRPLRFIRSCSSPLPPSVLSELERVFHVPVIEAYGMTEASHQISSNPLPPAERKPGSVGKAAGTQVALMNEQGDILPGGEVGEIVIRGGNVIQGYAANPQANRIAFSRGWLRTGDQGYLDSSGYLFITGRIKELINRGGEKISPREVDEVLLEHPAIAQAVTFGIPDRRLGEEIAAAVVFHADGQATEKELRTFVAQRLALFKVPRYIVIVDAIPKGPTGKVQRLSLAKLLGFVSDDTTAIEEKMEYVAPRNVLEEQIATIWAQVIGYEEVGVTNNFFQLGGDSLMAEQVISRVNDVLQVNVPMLAFFEAPTIADLAALIGAQKEL